MKRTGIDKICTYLEEKKISVEEVIRIAFYAGNLEGNKEIIVADEEAEMSLVADVSEDVIRASHNQHSVWRDAGLSFSLVPERLQEQFIAIHFICKKVFGVES